VVVCTIWWVVNRPQTYVFTGDIDGLDIGDTVSSAEVYLKEWSEQNGSDKEISFVAISTEPFARGQVYRIYFKRATEEVMRKTKSKPLEVEYDGHLHRKFFLVGDSAVPFEELRQKLVNIEKAKRLKVKTSRAVKMRRTRSRVVSVECPSQAAH
jgi:hypothetical protein